MVITLEDGQAVDKQHIYFICAMSGPILVGISRDPKATLAAYEIMHHETLELMASRKGDRAELQSIRVELAHHHIRSDWFAPSPEVLEYVAGRRPGTGPRGGVLGRKLSEREVLEVFRLAHDSPHGYAAIGARYGVGVVSVSRIARGHVYKHLFKREAAPEEPVQAGLTAAALADLERVFYISEDRHGAPRYRLVEGKRGRK